VCIDNILANYTLGCAFGATPRPESKPLKPNGAMRKIITLAAASLVVTLVATLASVQTAQAAKEGFCNGGGCCDYADPVPGMQCERNGPSYCYSNGSSCYEECSWYCHY
jgi:hypothetical protein